jgi:hypothetical protein
VKFEIIYDKKALQIKNNLHALVNEGMMLVDSSG